MALAQAGSQDDRSGEGQWEGTVGGASELRATAQPPTSKMS